MRVIVRQLENFWAAADPPVNSPNISARRERCGRASTPEKFLTRV